MGPGLTFVVYLTLWWIVFLAILPMGTVSHAGRLSVDQGDGGDPGGAAGAEESGARRADPRPGSRWSPAGRHLAHRCSST